MDKVRMEIIGLASSPQSSGSFALILQETGGPRRMSILIGTEPAQSIAGVLEGIKPPRPNTHDLMLNIIQSMGANLKEVVITELREGTFYSSLIIDATPSEIDARPSDAIALAIRCGAPIFVTESVLSEAGVIPGDDEYEEDEEYEEGSEYEDASDEDTPKSLRDVLQSKLNDAVAKEDYERAAQLRDEIDQLDKLPPSS